MGIRPRAVAVTPEENYMLRVTFDTGECRMFDVKPYLCGSWYGRLRDPKLFRSVRIAGLSIEWQEGQDICPDCLYEDSVPVGGQ